MMSVQRTFCLCAAAATLAWLAGAGATSAQPPGGPRFGFGGPGRGGPPGAELFERFDKNKDGKLSKDEVPEMMWSRLGRADANDDGAVTKDELPPMGGPRGDVERPKRPERPGPEAREKTADKKTDGEKSVRDKDVPRRGPPEARRGGRPAAPPAWRERLQQRKEKADEDDEDDDEDEDEDHKPARRPGDRPQSDRGPRPWWQGSSLHRGPGPQTGPGPQAHAPTPWGARFGAANRFGRGPGGPQAAGHPSGPPWMGPNPALRARGFGPFAGRPPWLGAQGPRAWQARAPWSRGPWAAHQGQFRRGGPPWQFRDRARRGTRNRGQAAQRGRRQSHQRASNRRGSARRGRGPAQGPPHAMRGPGPGPAAHPGPPARPPFQSGRGPGGPPWADHGPPQMGPPRGPDGPDGPHAGPPRMGPRGQTPGGEHAGPPRMGPRGQGPQGPAAEGRRGPERGPRGPEMSRPRD